MNAIRFLLTRGLAANMAEEGCNFLHLLQLASSGTKPKWLKESGSSDEGVVIPETNSVRNRGVALGEEFLKLVNLEEISDGLVTTVDTVRTLPTFVTNL